MLNDNGNPMSDEATRLKMAEGNTLFMLGGANVFADDETEDEFGLMPYLSEDGTQNAFIMNVSRYMGINKRLEEKGNEQKLTDALHVMEVLSTVKGMKALNKTYANTLLLPLKDYVVEESEGYYAEIEDEINAGMTAPFIYDGWENVIVATGRKMIDFLCGKAELSDVVQAFDANQHLIEDNSTASYTTVTEKLDTDACAKAIGICFAQESGALYPLPLTDQEITSILPTGWTGNIMTVTLSGQRIQELAEYGYDRNGDGRTFPYELVMPSDLQLEKDTVYTVAICGVTDAVAEEGKLTDTGIQGLTAAQKYFSRFDTLSLGDLVWE